MHIPTVQLTVWFGPGAAQTVHDAPQNAVSMFEAQIGPAGPGQKWVPELQASLQLPFSHVACAPGRSHVLPQPPQLASEVLMSTHDPLHSVLPAGQTAAQSNLLLATGAQKGRGLLHCLLQVPQLFLVLSEVSQPFVTLESQLPKPGWHAS